MVRYWFPLCVVSVALLAGGIGPRRVEGGLPADVVGKTSGGKSDVVSAAATGELAAEPAEVGGRIAGTVMEIRTGTHDVVVILCDQQTGLPLSQQKLRPFTEGARSGGMPKLATAITDQRGRFAFEGLPPGEYRLVAQKWVGPFKGMFEIHGTVIQLFGSAGQIRVPSTEAERVVLTPLGDGVLHLDQDVPNSETLLVLSTGAPAGDPILGFYGLGKAFLRNMIGTNRMPYGRTTVIGVPREEVHAFFFAADSAPGFAVQKFRVRGFERPQRVPFVASWSDGRHEPPAKIRRTMEVMKKHGLRAAELLGVDSNLSPQQRHEAHLRLADQLDRKVELPDGHAATVGDLMAAESYAALQAELERRRRKK